ncbi:H-NS family nucleoid-associated regulatory protein [Crenobacter cavernae]|nr:H-NS histone family protein [Crenobacter cavernae]
MSEYLDLHRSFGLLTKHTAAELFVPDVLGKRLTWDKVLEGRFSVIVGRANFGKTMELQAKSKALRAQGHSAVYVALHNVLGENDFQDALDACDLAALMEWKQSDGVLTVFVDSLDEASLGTENGIRKALRRLSKALDWPNSDVRWVLSSRPAVLTEDVLELLQAELRTTLYVGDRQSSSDEDEFDSAFAETVAASEKDSEDEQEASEAEQPDTAIGDVASADAASKTENKAPAHEQMKVYALQPLDKAGAELYLGSHLGMPQPKETLSAARQYGLGRLAEGPGGLDILAYIDPVQNPPQYLTQVFERMVEAVQQQQRTDPRECRVGSPPPENLEEAIERLASASAVCQLPNIEISPKALRIREGVLSARPIIASLLSEQSLAYVLGSRLFIDSGQHQVKLYPDELLPFLAAKRLASLVKSPEHAHRLLANFTWRSTTGECGVYRALFPLAGWLAAFSVHCRKELLNVEPQAVAFFGDLRSPQVQLAEASTALERTIERLVSEGDSLGRSYYTLTDENYWQAAKPGIEPALKRLFEKYGADLHARDALLDIAGHARLEAFRNIVLDAHGRDYSKLLDEQLDLNYILSLGREDDLTELGTALRGKSGLSESRAARLVAELAWKALDARSMAEIAAEQLRRGAVGFSIDWVLTRDVAVEASDADLYRLTRSLLLRLVNYKVGPGSGTGEYFDDRKFIELVMDLLALVIKRSAVEPSKAAKLCLVLSRFVKKSHYGSADTVKLRAALQVNKEVRLEFLRGLIHPTDKTMDAIFRAVFWFRQIYPLVDGDEVELGEPGFTELIETWKKSAAESPRKPTKRRDRGLIVDGKSKKSLLGMLDGLQDASEKGALAWVAQWLSLTIQQPRYSECNFELFVRAAGNEIAHAAREGLSTLWRSKDPTWNENEPNSTYNITIAGLQGLHLDLGDGSRLLALSEQDVRRAIRYAQFEINGYPKWFWSLVRAHEQVATQELSVILASANKGQVSLDKAETLIRHLHEAPIGVQQSLARAAWDFVLSNPQFAEYTSKAALKVAAGVIDQATFEVEAWRRIGSAFDEEIPSLGDTPDVKDAEAQKVRQKLEKRVHELRHQRSNAVVWGGFWLWSSPGTFSQRWESWRACNPRAAEGFMLALAADLGEDHGAGLKQVVEKGSVGLNTIKMLYEWVCSVVREEDDIKREDGRVYSPGERDHAQCLRDALVPAISHAKSELAYVVLEELRQRAAGPSAKYLRYVQFMMREEQYTRKPIAQTDYHEFERSFASSVSEYMAFAMAVETDLLTVKSQIETGDFSLRRFFNSLNFTRIKTDNDGLALEEDFQALLGSELNHAAGSRYVVTLESILPEGTRRDVLCQTGSLRATVELKMSFRWTLADYIEALEKQLQGQYMQAPDSNIGFFVVVLQKQRTWDGPDSKPIGFDELLSILKSKAREKEVADSSVYLRVIGIDATPKEDFRSAKKASKATDGAAALKYADRAGNTWSGRGRQPKWVKDALASGRSLNDLLATNPES